ncbi:cryptochrome 2 isoform 2-T2 [Aphomia sociella]
MSAGTETLSAASRRRTHEPSTAPSTQCPAAKHTVHWFRKGLRLHDNPALRDGLNGALTFRCVFIIDPWFASSSNVGINKWRFLLQCLEDLDSSLRKLNSRLFVVRGQPADVLPKLFKEWGTTVLTFEEDPEPYGRVRDYNIMSKCRDVGITVVSRVSHTLYKLDKIIERNGGKAPLTYHQFQALIASMPPPPPAETTITPQMLNGITTPITSDHEDRFGVPTLEELGFETEGLKPTLWLGGETEALVRLERHLERKAWVASFGRPKMTPQSLFASQTGLSPYLRFGCLSTRLFYYQLSDLYKRVKQVRPPLSLHGQILWREFFYCAATRNPNFDRMEGNPICVQIPWEKNDEALAKWASGQTGFPWIDAIMIQLREEGWIHHLARHAVACFLTRGDLWISWEEGMKVFDELLLDADWSVNAGMWMWLSCSSFFQQFFHCYCPVQFGRRTDPNGDFIRKYLPVLKNIPTKYIHEPWMAPDSVQQAARCTIGRDYPLPMVNHAEVSQINIERIKLVYTQLAKYKPQATLNSQTTQRHHNMKSNPSPGPTSSSSNHIIKSVNKTNYMCSQATQAQNATPQTMPYKDTAVFQQPSNQVLRADTKQQQLKQVVIVQQIHNPGVTISPGVITRAPRLPENYIINGQINMTYKANQKIETLQSIHTQENYDFKNLAINNYNQDCLNTELYQHQQPNRNEIYQQAITHSNYIYLTPKCYLTSTDNGVQNMNSDSSTFAPVIPVQDYKGEEKTTNEKSDRDLSLNDINSKIIVYTDATDESNKPTNENDKPTNDNQE